MPTYDQVRDRLIQAQPHIQPNILLDLAQDFKIEARTAEIIETLEEFLEELENRQDLLPDQPLEQSVKSFRTLYAKFDLDTRDLPNEPVEPPEAQPEEEPGSRRPSEKFLNSFTAAFKNMPLVELMQVLRHLGNEEYCLREHELDQLMETYKDREVITSRALDLLLQRIPPGYNYDVETDIVTLIGDSNHSVLKPRLITEGKKLWDLVKEERTSKLKS